jgi:hypothetical protein
LVLVDTVAHKEVLLTNQREFVQLQEQLQLLLTVVQTLPAALTITNLTQIAMVAEHTLTVINTVVVAKPVELLLTTII